MLFTIGLKTMLQTPLLQTVSLYFKFKNYVQLLTTLLIAIVILKLIALVCRTE